MIRTLQAGRFLAAMAVVLHHTGISVAAFVALPPELVLRVLNYGYLGVDFFFVLSGFIIHYTMSQQPRAAGRFLGDRLGRIMLPYWPVGLALALAYTFLPALSEGNRSWGWGPTLTLFPTASPPALSVAWTLQHELVFYAIYALLYRLRLLVPGLAVWSIAIILGGLWQTPDWPLLRLMLAPINVEFIAGIAVAALFLSRRTVSPVWHLSVCGGFVLAFVLLGGPRDQSWLVGFAIAALVPWLCRSEEAGGFSVPDWLVFGGAASYAIYLTHNPVLSLVSRGLATTGLGWGPAMIMSVVICIGMGAAYFLCWERPVMRWVRRGRGTAATRPS